MNHELLFLLLGLGWSWGTCLIWGQRSLGPESLVRLLEPTPPRGSRILGFALWVGTMLSLTGPILGHTAREHSFLGLLLCTASGYPAAAARTLLGGVLQLLSLFLGIGVSFFSACLSLQLLAWLLPVHWTLASLLFLAIGLGTQVAWLLLLARSHLVPSGTRAVREMLSIHACHLVGLLGVLHLWTDLGLRGSSYRPPSASIQLLGAGLAAVSCLTLLGWIVLQSVRRHLHWK